MSSAPSGKGELPLQGTPFSVNFVFEQLRAHVADPERFAVANVRDFSFDNLSAGAAFMSVVYRLRFEWKEAASLKSVVLKVPEFQNPSNFEDVKDVEIYLEHAHTRECDFYQFFTTLPYELALPKYYYGFEFSQKHDRGLIIMEDLSRRARTLRMLPGFSHEQTLALVRTLADIHAASMLKREWLPIYAKSSHSSKNFIEGLYTATLKLKDIKPEWFSELVDDLKPVITGSGGFRNCVYESEKFGVPSCTVHGDLWAPNVLWQHDEEASAPRVAAIIDWQSSYAGNPGADLARILCMNTSVAYRRGHTEIILQAYVDRVREFSQGQLDFTLVQITQLYKAALPFVSAFAGFGATCYYNMASVVGEPADEARRHELLDRVRCTFEDTLAIYREEQASKSVGR